MPHDRAAFPRPSSNMAGEYGNEAQTGMSVRQWYKGQVVAGFLASMHGGTILPPNERIAQISAAIADALLIEDEQHAASSPADRNDRVGA